LNSVVNGNNNSSYSTVVIPIGVFESGVIDGRRLSRIRTPSLRLREASEDVLKSRRRPTEDINIGRDENLNRVLLDINDSINKDAKKYKKNLEKLTRFVLCGICGIDDCITKMVSYEKAKKNIETCDELINGYNILSNLNNEYSKCVKNAFNEFGVLKIADNICNYCFKKTMSKRKSGEKDCSDDEGDNCENMSNAGCSEIDENEGIVEVEGMLVEEVTEERSDIDVGEFDDSNSHILGRFYDLYLLLVL
jgi:hypothetical protein